MKWLDKFKRAVKPEAQAEQDSPVREEPVPTGQPTAPQTEPTLQATCEVLSAADGQTVSGLSPREAEVFRRLLDGAKMKDIATELGVMTSTVNGYCRQVYRKLGVNSKAQLILRYSEYRK